MGQGGEMEVEFYLKGVATITIALFGILGNLISIRFDLIRNYRGRDVTVIFISLVSLESPWMDTFFQTNQPKKNY